MTGLAGTVEGVDTFVRTLDAAARQLVDLDQVNTDNAQAVLGVVDPPIRTGRLAKTVKATADALGFTLTAGGPEAPYGPIVHARNPFLTRALEARETAVVDAYADHIDTTLNQIKGT